MKNRGFFAELRRRNVYKVAVAYAVVAWLLIQAASILFPTFEAPAWVMKVFVVVIILGFPVALILAWAFEITPEGIKLESEIEPTKSIARRTGRKIVAVTIALAVVAAGLFVYQLVRSVGIDRRAVRSAEGEEDGRRSATSLPVPGKSIAVLPFDNLSHEQDNAYFAEGVQDEILTRLAKVADLKVISRTSTQKYKSAPDNLRAIAQQLGVANVLEGSVQKSQDQVRVNVQLINALTDAHLWADTYDRKLTDIFAVESEIAKTIADTLQAKLTGAEKRAIAARPTENQEAYQLYLKGRFFWNKRTATDLRKSIDYFQQAIAKDANYALAYAGAAQAWLLLPGYGGGRPSDCFPEADAAAKKALSLDDSSADAHAALAMVRGLYYFDLVGAIAECERAIELDPNNATAHHWFANHPLAAAGQTERQIAEMKRALELDPLSLIINTNLGEAYIYARRYDDAIAQFRKTVEMDAGFYFAHYMLGGALELKGQLPEAMAEYQKAIALNDDPFPKGMLGHLYGKVGRKDEALQILSQLRLAREQRYVEAYILAIVYLGVGDHNEAVNWLEQGYRDRDGFNIAVIRVDPFLDPLHGDPRFEALAEKIVPAREFGKTATAKK